MRANKGAKRPAAAYNPQVTKEPATAAAVSTDSMKPSWHVSTMDLEGPFGWKAATAEHIWEILHPKLVGFESMTWGEILNASKRNHWVDVAALSKPARARLAQIKRDDATRLLSLRLRGEERLWGLRVAHVFQVLWWDPEHAVCPSVLKHT